ncbi:hypothetical protein JOE37_001715 [Clavibacter michiganensis]|nr:hypothetical protein [Clavibacter michiganensis]
MLVVLVAIPLLGGCTSIQPTPSPVASVPAQKQEQQDAQSFEDLFADFVAIDLSAETPDDLTPLLTGSALQGELDSLKYSEENKQRVIGKPTSRNFRVTDRGTDGQGVDYMTAQACLDVSGTRTLDADGHDITPSRDNVLSLQMKAVKLTDGSWRISDSVRNEDTHACD